jgi:hypothetical protein
MQKQNAKLDFGRVGSNGWLQVKRRKTTARQHTAVQPMLEKGWIGKMVARR